MTPGVIYRTLRLQSAAYALLIHENFGVPVRRGYLVYTRSQNRLVEIIFTVADFHQVGSLSPRNAGNCPPGAAPCAGAASALRGLLLPIYLHVRVDSF